MADAASLRRSASSPAGNIGGMLSPSVCMARPIPEAVSAMLQYRPARQTIGSSPSIPASSASYIAKKSFFNLK